MEFASRTISYVPEISCHAVLSKSLAPLTAKTRLNSLQSRSATVTVTLPVAITAPGGTASELTGEKASRDRHQQNVLCECPFTSRPRAVSCDGNVGTGKLLVLRLLATSNSVRVRSQNLE